MNGYNDLFWNLSWLVFSTVNLSSQAGPAASLSCPAYQGARPHWRQVRAQPGAPQPLNSHFTPPAACGGLWCPLPRLPPSLSWTFGIWGPLPHGTALAGSGLGAASWTEVSSPPL